MIRKKWMYRELQQMGKLYPSMTNQELAARFNTTRSVVEQFAFRYGWRKSAEHLHQVRNRRHN